MGHSLVRVWIHAIFSTKHREVLIISSVEKCLFTHLKERFEEKGCGVRIINDMADHIHCLFLLKSVISIADLMQYLKGETSKWIKAHHLIENWIGWQDGYAAFSVSDRQLETVQNYIKKSFTKTEISKKK